MSERKENRTSREKAGMMPGARKSREERTGYGERGTLFGELSDVSHEKENWEPGNLLYPLPVVMVSCQRPGEKPNIITLAWAGTICSSPAMVSISVRPERYSYGIIKETGEFVINLVNRELVYATDYCGVRSGRDVDKFNEMNLTPDHSGGQTVPSIRESPVNIRCRVTQSIPLGSHDVFLAEVTGITVDKAYLDEKGKFHLNSSGLVAYSHGEYFQLGEKLGKFGYSVQKKQGRSASAARHQKGE